MQFAPASDFLHGQFMQDRFVGDIGDFAKYGLLRALSQERRLGVAWYLMPDEAKTNSGNKLGYLDRPNDWRSRDPELFDRLRDIVSQDIRSVESVVQSGLLGNCVHASERLFTDRSNLTEVGNFRRGWFRRTVEALQDCDIVFADPDNGVCRDDRFSPTRRSSWKSIPYSEVAYLTSDRVGIIYHHNTRYKGGHRQEIDHWQSELPGCTAAVYWQRGSPRTFFVINADSTTVERLQDFMQLWHGSCSVIWNTKRKLGKPSG